MITVLLSASSTSPNKGGARRIFQAASHSAAGSASPIKVPSSRRLKSFWPSPMAVQPLTSSGISTGNESFDISANEWRPDRLMRFDLVPPETAGVPQKEKMQPDDRQTDGQRQNPFRLARNCFCQPSEVCGCRHKIGVKIGVIPARGTQNSPK